MVLLCILGPMRHRHEMLEVLSTRKVDVDNTIREDEIVAIFTRFVEGMSAKASAFLHINVIVLH